MSTPGRDDSRAAVTAQRRWVASLLIIAAGGIFLPTLFGELWPRGVPDTRMLLASVSATDTTIQAVLSQPVWSEIRGHGEGPLHREARAVRLGAAITELKLRQRRPDPATQALATNVATLLRTFPDSDEAVRAWESFDPTADDSAIRSAAALAERAAGRRGVRLGAWLQGARFAAVAGDSGAFTDAAIRSVSLAAIASDARPETEHAVRQFGSIARERPRDLVALATAVEELLRLLGTR